VRSSSALIVLLTRGYLTWPFCIVEPTKAVSEGIPLIPMRVLGISYDFDYTNGMQANLDDTAWEVVLNQGFTREQVAEAVNHFSRVVSFPFESNSGANLIEFQVQ